jgi:hypothetical protein
VAVVLAFAAVFLCCFAVAADRSGAYVYWTDNSGNVSRANLDGTGVSNGFYASPTGSFGIASNGQQLYWSVQTFDDNHIRRANIDGSGATRFLNIFGAYGLAATNSNLYWAGLLGNSVGRYGLVAPGNLTQGLVSPALNAYSVAVDSNYIYWTNSSELNGQGSIGRASLDGAVKQPNFIPNLTNPRGVTVDDGHVYWTNFGSNAPGPGTIGRANLDGSNPDNGFITGASNPIGIAVNGTHIYWANFGSASNSIGRANLNGTSPDQNFITASDRPSFLAIDSRQDPPTLSIDSGPSGPTGAVTPSFGFSAQGGSVVACSIDTGTPNFGPCTSAGTHQPGSPLVDGSYTFRVRAVLGGETSDRSRSFTVDTVAPDTQITIGPPETIDTPNVTIFFGSPDDATNFQCRLNDGEWLQCTETDYADYNGLPDGNYVFRVRALDAVGNADPTPAESNFTIDTSPVPDPDPEPNLNFTFGKVTPNRKSGTAALQVRVPGAGRVQLLGSRTVTASSRSASRKSTVVLTVKPRGAAARTLKRKGTVKVKASVRFTPAGGTARTRATTVKLIKRR